MHPRIRDTATKACRNLCGALGLSMLMAVGALAQDIISGAARVIDADILIVAGQRVILWGLDAPERPQPCYLDGKEWGCHAAAKRTLEALAGRGDIDCILTGEADPFGRRHGVCTYGDEDLNAQMVLRGMALAFSEQTTDYDSQQIEAITAGVGLWQPGAEFMEPWIWRRANTPGGFR